MADYAYFLSLRRLEHCQGVDNCGKSVGVERAEALVDEEILKTDVT